MTGKERELCVASRGTTREREIEKESQLCVGCLLVARIVFLHEERRAWRLRMGSADRIAGTKSHVVCAAPRRKRIAEEKNTSSKRFPVWGKLEKKINNLLGARAKKLRTFDRWLCVFITLTNLRKLFKNSMDF